jgi:hypothetical protein
MRMVEDVLKNSEDSIITIPEIKRSLPRSVNHLVLMEILQYFEENLKIYVSLKGITWVENDSPKMKKALKEAIEM